MKDNRPIGIFDSGVGGLTVVRALIDKLPNENFIYFGDTAHVPYGNKTKEQLMKYAIDIINFFISKDVKAIVVACGTHSSVTLPELITEYDIPILGVVKPGARAAVKSTKNKRIGILATQATVNSQAYTNNILEISKCFVHEIACKSFVPLVESGMLSGPETNEAVTEYVTPLLENNVDTIVLGCTHYPFLTLAIKEFTKDNITLVDPADETINELVDMFIIGNLLNENNIRPSAQFYVSGNDESFYNVGRLLMGNVINNVRKINLDED